MPDEEKMKGKMLAGLQNLAASMNFQLTPTHMTYTSGLSGGV
jgi:hypothetical protein